ncbi:MAG: rod shape-determining protein RodA [Candidatus Gottesmanbacteria bacterium]
MGRFFKNFDWLIFIPITVLSGFSLAVLASPNEGYFSSQLLAYIIGLVLFFIVSQIDWQIYKSLAKVFYIILIFLLLLTFLGPQVRGATRWIDFLGIRWQPSELVKPLFIISLASFFSSHSTSNLKNLFLGLLIMIPPVFLIFRQPDLGTAIIMSGIWAGIIYGSGLPFLFGLGGMFVFFLFVPFSWFLLKDYQKDRLIHFFNPFFDPSGAGYNSIQAMIAVGSGQLLGRGLGQGSQSHLLFLPEHHTDFIFASLVEELGFVGGAMVIFAYILLLWQLLRITKKTSDQFAQLILFGIFSQIILQIFINIGMNLGFLPITGITLPLVSYGGSSIVSLMISLGIVVNINKSTRSNQTFDILGFSGS